jgi:hypothetical protein
MKASQIIKNKLKNEGGTTYVTLLNGGQALISIGRLGEYFISDKLPNQQMYWSIFDIVVDFLNTQPNKLAIKGNCRNSKVGGEKCSKDTVIYEVATKYYGKKEGESSFDPLFVIAAILEWANIAINERGYIKLV